MEIKKVINILEELEFIGFDSNSNSSYCPICFHIPYIHYEDCKLDKIIKELKIKVIKANKDD